MNKPSNITGKLGNIEQSITVRIADMGRELERQGKRVIKLQTGDPDFDTPEVIINAAFEALKLRHTHYADSRGLLALREVIAQKLYRDNGLKYDPLNEILVTHGGIHAIFAIINALIEPGDRVLIIDPCWMPYVSSTLIAGGTPVRIPTSREHGFRVQPDQIAAHLDKKAKLLILNSPCNPTGNTLTLEELQKIARLVERHNLLVVADEVYEKLIYDGHEHISFASLPGMRERTITVNSLSKTYAMTGWRIGYLAAEKSLVEQFLKISQYSITNVAPFIQMAAIVALTDPEVQSFVEVMKNTYDKRRLLIIDKLKRLEGIRAVIPQGAFYFMVDISHFCQDSALFSTHFLEKEQVGVVPGVSFGICAEGFIRLTFAAGEEEIMEGISRLHRLLQIGFAKR